MPRPPAPLRGGRTTDDPPKPPHTDVPATPLRPTRETPPMSCQLICPNLRCRKILKVPEEARGKVVRCQHCQTMLRVPPARRETLAPPAGASSSPFAPAAPAADRPLARSA